MNVYMFNFSKKNNSTKVPAGTGSGTLLQCELKDNCSIMNPILRISDANIMLSWNYVFIPYFGRYYFINNMEWSAGAWEVGCTVDALGSWKTEIGTSTQYVLRHNSAVDFNSLITDTFYPATNDYQTVEEVLTSPWASAIQTGVYILGIISNEDTNSVGAINYYAMTSQQFGDLKNELFSDHNLFVMGFTDAQGIMQITDCSKELLKTMYNPFQYIVSCTWFPFGISSFDHAPMNTILQIGWWQYNLNNYPLYAQQLSFLNAEYTFIPAHPQAAARGAYLNYAPYTRISVYGRFGTISLDTSYVKAGYRLNFSYYVDAITGQCRVEIRAWDPQAQNPNTVTLAERNFLLGVPIQLSQVGVDYLGSALSAVDTAAGVVSSLTHFDLGGAVSSAAHGIYNTLKTSMPIVETSGANGSFLSPFKLTKVNYHFYQIADEDIVHKGRPLCENRTLNTLSGFILCADGDMDLSCTEEEKSIIKGHLTGGFFWE